jgi:hypothetical protein
MQAVSNFLINGIIDNRCLEVELEDNEALFQLNQITCQPPA